MSFDFAVETVEAQSETEDADDEGVSVPFESNEVAEIYLSFGDWKNVLGEMLEALDLEPLKIYSDDTLEDLGRLLGEYQEAHPQQKLHMVASLAKSTAGKMQRDNEHGIGLRNGEAPEEHFEESYSYALHFSDLPSITWDDLDGGERESLEEMGINPSELGFDTVYGGPKLLVVNGQRLPIAVEEGNEVMEAADLLKQIPDEPSAYTEDGFRESSDPSVFGDSETENGGTEQDDDEDTDLAANPEAVRSFRANDIRSAVTDITNLRAIQTMLRVEADSDDPRSTVISRLKERRNALQNGQGEDDEEAEADDGDEEVSLDEIRSLFDLSDLEADAVEYRVNSGKAENYREAAQQVSDL